MAHLADFVRVVFIAVYAGGCHVPETHGHSEGMGTVMGDTRVTSTWGPSTGEEETTEGSGTSTTDVLPSGSDTDAESSGQGSSGEDSESGGNEVSECWLAGWDWEFHPGWALWGSGPEDVWMVGWLDGPSEPSVVHFDGLQWQTSALTQQDLVPVAVTGSGPADVYIAGQDGRLLRFQDSWQLDQVVLQDPAIWAVGPGEVVVVGQGAEYMRRSTEGTWQTLPLPVSASLRAVTGSGPEDVFAVGDMGVAMHHNGEVWTLLPSPSATDLTAVASTQVGSAIAVGADGTVWHLDAANISVVPPPGGLGLHGVWATNEGHIMAISTQLLHVYNGDNWEQFSLPFFDAATAIWGTKTGRLHIGGRQTSSLHCRPM